MPIKGPRGLIPLAYYLAVTVVVVDMATNEELAKNLETLSECVNTIQDKMVTLERGATHSGADLLNRVASVNVYITGLGACGCYLTWLS